MTISITIKVIPNKKKFVDFNKAQREIVQYFDDIGDDIVSQMQEYPPPPENSTYTRTGRLGQGWYKSITTPASGIYLRIRNRVYYAQYVQGEKQRELFAWIGWRTLKSIVDPLRKSIRKDIQSIINRNIDT